MTTSAPTTNEADGADAVGEYDPRVKVIGYARVSTKEQDEDGASLAAQEHAIRAYADRKGWALEMVHEVSSGTTMRKRPKMREVLERLDSGEAECLIVTKVDRLSRNVPHAFLTLDRSKDKGWRLVLIDMDIDTTTANGRMLFGQMAVFAQYFRDQISENTKAALAQKRREGVILGRPLAGHGRKDGPAELAEAQRKLSRLRELRAQGLSYRKIADAMNAEGIPGLQGGRWWDRSARLALIKHGDA